MIRTFFFIVLATISLSSCAKKEYLILFKSDVSAETKKQYLEELKKTSKTRVLSQNNQNMNEVFAFSVRAPNLTVPNCFKCQTPKDTCCIQIVKMAKIGNEDCIRCAPCCPHIVDKLKQLILTFDKEITYYELAKLIKQGIDSNYSEIFVRVLPTTDTQGLQQFKSFQESYGKDFGVKVTISIGELVAK